MKIAVASDDGITISQHFGQTRGFAVREVSDGKIVKKIFVENTFTGHARGMEHVHDNKNEHSQHELQNKHDVILRALQGCTAVISNGMGKKIYMDLQNAGIQPIICDIRSVDEAIELFLRNELIDHPERGCAGHEH